MADGQRSPFGGLVHAYRRGLSLSQPGLAKRANQVSKTILNGGTVSDRTVNAIERTTDDPANWHVPHQSTVTTLCKVFGLEPGTTARNAFMDAATISKALTRQVAPGDDDSDYPSPPFVEAGREPHLARLRQEVDAAVARQAGVVFVSADYGAGKSRLIHEICREAVKRHPGLVTLWGYCPEPGETPLSHAPFRHIVRLMVGDVTVARPEQLVSRANESRMAVRAPDAARALATDGRLLINRVLSDETLWNDTLASALDPEQLRRVNLVLQGAPPLPEETPSMCEQFFRVLSGYAAGGPIVLVLEDLHRADSGTIESLTHLIQRLHRQALPVLIIGSYRPGALAPAPSGERHPLPTMLHDTSRIFLDPIVDLSTSVGGEPGRAFIDQLLHRAFTDYPRDLAGALFERTAGLPLFVTEILRMYRQGKSITGLPDNGARPDVEPAPDHAMEAIRTLFVEQLGQLSSEHREILNAACVQGNAFSAEPIIQALGLSEPAWMTLVDAQLVRRYRLLVAGQRSSIDGHAFHQYQFSHALLRDHIYHELSEAERSRHHAATAGAMLVLYGEQDHEANDAIAWHFDQAGDPKRAAPAYLRAGVHAMILRDYARAIRHFRRVQELHIQATDPTTHVHSFIGLGNCRRGMGEAVEAQRMLDQAIVLALRHHLPLVRAHALESMAMLDFDAGNMREGADRLEMAIDIFRASDELDDAARALANLSYLLYGQGRYEAAMAVAEGSRVLAVQVGNDRIWVDARNARGICLIDLGFADQAMEIYQDCVELCREIEDVHREDLCWLNISLAALEMEQWEIAIDAVEHILAGPGHTPRLVAAAEFNAGVIAEGMKDIPTARMHYANSREIREGNEQQALLIDSLAGLLRIALIEGDTKTAGTLRSDISHRIDQRGQDGVEHSGRLLVTLIEAERVLGDARAARDRARWARSFVTGRANQVNDPAYRQGYLNMKAHRRIFELAAALDSAAYAATG